MCDSWQATKMSLVLARFLTGGVLRFLLKVKYGIPDGYQLYIFFFVNLIIQVKISNIHSAKNFLDFSPLTSILGIFFDGWRSSLLSKSSIKFNL